MEWNTSSIISHTKTYWPDKSCKLCQSQKICEILEYTDFTWPTYSRITAQKNEEILNGKLHFLFSVYKLNNDYLLNLSGSYFPALGLNMERDSVSLLIQSVCGKMRNKKTPEYEHFLHSIPSCIWLDKIWNLK